METGLRNCFLHKDALGCRRNKDRDWTTSFKSATWVFPETFCSFMGPELYGFGGRWLFLVFPIPRDLRLSIPEADSLYPERCTFNPELRLLESAKIEWSLPPELFFFALRFDNSCCCAFSPEQISLTISASSRKLEILSKRSSPMIMCSTYTPVNSEMHLHFPITPYSEAVSHEWEYISTRVFLYTARPGRVWETYERSVLVISHVI